LANLDSNNVDEWRLIKDEIEKKKKEFEANLDPHLSADEKATMIHIFSNQMNDLERDLTKEKEA
jgi:hypothetical protein